MNSIAAFTHSDIVLPEVAAFRRACRRLPPRDFSMSLDAIEDTIDDVLDLIDDALALMEDRS
jgi:hypothetical protein